MKDEKNGSPDKPFYQNILEEKNKRQEKAKATAAARKARKEPGNGGFDSRRGEAERPLRQPSRDGAPRGGAASRGNDRPSRGFRPEGAPGFPFSEGVSRPPRRPYVSFKAPESGMPVFSGLSDETKRLLDDFPSIVQSVMPLDSRKLQQIPQEIRELSHELTDERSERRIGYMNEPPVLSAYIRYYMWWNLVRLTRLFSGLPVTLDDGDAAVDLGSGPLTLPIALWMARPELRVKKITWYCVDLSQNALSSGEELFLSLAAKTGQEPWQIVRIKGELGVSLRRRVRLVASANMFNELFWDDPEPIEAQAKRHAKSLASYAEESASVLLVEPGVPLAGRFVSLMRDSLIRLGFKPVSPCPHENVCPLPGLRGGKWCHFVFDTADAPKALHKLSDDAGLSKDRAALSFVYAKREEAKTRDEAGATDASGELETAWASDREDAGGSETPDAAAASPVASAPVASAPVASAPVASDLERVSLLAGRFSLLPVRIASDPIRLPDFRTGRYGCSELGMVMVTGSGPSGKWLSVEESFSPSSSGSLLQLPRPAVKRPPRDEKTGAILIELDGGASSAPRDRDRPYAPRDRDGASRGPRPDSRGPREESRDRPYAPRDRDRDGVPRGPRPDSRGPREESRDRPYAPRGPKSDRPFGRKPGTPRKDGRE